MLSTMIGYSIGSPFTFLFLISVQSRVNPSGTENFPVFFPQNEWIDAWLQPSVVTSIQANFTLVYEYTSARVPVSLKYTQKYEYNIHEIEYESIGLYRQAIARLYISLSYMSTPNLDSLYTSPIVGYIYIWSTLIIFNDIVDFLRLT